MTQIYINSAAAAVICLWAIWCVITHRVNDGFFGKIMLSGLAISAFANFIEPLTAYALQREAEISMHTFMALLCLRHFIIKMVWTELGLFFIRRFFPAFELWVRKEKRRLKRRIGDKKYDI